jgi:ribosomal protein L37AE/L43A
MATRFTWSDVFEWLKAAVARPPPGGGSRRLGERGGRMNYEILLDGEEPIDNWSVCKVCLNVDRTTSVVRRRWRCSDCRVDSSNNSQQPLRVYLAENDRETLEKNLREWIDTKGVRPAFKMLKSARYKCLLTLSKREIA